MTLPADEGHQRLPGKVFHPQDLFETDGRPKRSLENASQDEGQRVVSAVKRQRVTSDRCTPVRFETSYLPSSMLLERHSALCVLSGFLNHLESNAIMGGLVLEIMSKSLNDPQMQLCGIQLLNACGSGICHSTKFVEVVVNSIEIHPQHQGLIVESLKTVRNLVRTDASCLYSLNANHLSTVLLSMIHENIKSNIIPHMGLDLLRLIASRYPTIRSSMARHTSDILKILVNTLEDNCMQQIGLSLLSWMVENEEARATVHEEGGILFLLSSMQRHGHDRMVQCNATATLCWLVHNIGDQTSTTIHQGLEDSTVNYIIRIVMNTIQKFLDNSSVLGNCICILSCLQPMEEGNIMQEVLDEMGIMQTALTGMKRHLRVSKVQLNCLNFLRLLSMRQENHRKLMLHLTGLESILDAMKEHSADASIQTQACCVLANACSSSEIHEVISKSDCVEIVTNCQFEHTDNPRVTQAAICFHDAMSRSASTKDAASIAAFGGGEPLIQMMLSGLAIDTNRLEGQQ